MAVGLSETCGRLMIGSGTDIYDPTCELPEGHAGSCKSTGAIDQHRLPERQEEDAMNATKIKGGRSVEDFLEGEAGGAHHKAVMLADLGSSVEGVRCEWEYDESPEGVELVRLCTELDRFLTDLSILPDGEITRYRECARCSGGGKTRGEDPCVECGGRGAVHADEANG